MAKYQYYAVKKGAVPGIYKTWDECKAQVDSFTGAEYKGFHDLQDAEEYMKSVAKKEVNDIDVTMDERAYLEISRSSNKAIAFVGGAYNEHTGVSTGAAVVFFGGRKQNIIKNGNDKKYIGMQEAGELLATMAAAEFCADRGFGEVVVCYGYEGTRKWATEEWQARKESTQAYRDFCWKISRRIDISFAKAERYSGIPMSEYVNTLAGKSM